MRSQRTKILTIRRLLLAAVVILGALVQNCALSVGSIQICILLPLTVIIAMFEKEFAGILYGILAGCLWDISTTTADGMKALFLALTGCVCGLLVRYIMRNNLMSALVLCGSASIVFNILHWCTYVLPNTEGMLRALFLFYIPQILLSILAVIPLYFLLRALEKKYKVAEEAR